MQLSSLKLHPDATDFPLQETLSKVHLIKKLEDYKAKVSYVLQFYVHSALKVL